MIHDGATRARSTLAFRALRASGTTIRPWRWAGLKSGFKPGTIYPRSCVFVTRVSLWSSRGPGSPLHLPSLLLSERCAHVYTSTHEETDAASPASPASPILFLFCLRSCGPKEQSRSNPCRGGR